MNLIDRFRDWARGYSEADIESAVDKLEQHWQLPPGQYIAMNHREMLAILREGLMPQFLEVRDVQRNRTMTAAALEEATKTEFPQERGNHHSSMVGYTVQAMFDYDSPRIIAGRVFDNRWREVSFDPAPEGFGVPAGDSFNAEIHKHGLYGYESAQALRWWLHAVARTEGSDYCLKTRLIAHKVVSDTKVTAVEAVVEEHYQRGMPSKTTVP